MWNSLVTKGFWSGEIFNKRKNNDLLTGLPNRLSILGSLSKSIIDSKKKNLTLAVLFLDLDGFKAVNDTHGHDIGDELLKIIAPRMQFL